MAIIITTLCEMYLRGAYGRDPDAVLTEKSVAPLSPATFIRQTLSLEVGLRLIRGERQIYLGKKLGRNAAIKDAL